MPGSSGGRGHEQQTEDPQEQQAHGGAPAGPWSPGWLAPGSGLPALLQSLPKTVHSSLEPTRQAIQPAMGVPLLPPGDLRKQQQAREQQRPPPS
jgi:hypothetical protein